MNSANLPANCPLLPMLNKVSSPERTEGSVVAPAPFDLASYVTSFNDTVLDAYRRGAEEAELDAEPGVARSLIPAGTAASRDFSALAPTMPEFISDACSGCMVCVSACPDSALFAVAIPESELAVAAHNFAQANEGVEAASLLTRFASPSRFGTGAAKRGLEPAQFGLFFDATKCKGCGVCVEVCPVAALRMVDKAPASEEAQSSIEQAAKEMEFFRTLPITPPAYRSEASLADLMLGEHAHGYTGGAGSCAGCGEGTAIRMLVTATRQVHGPESMGIVAATGCNSVFGATYPFNPYQVPWTNSLFENAPTVAMGIHTAWQAEGHDDRKLWVIGGDGAMYDIGFQSLSRLLASGMNIKVLVLDTQVYSNTGGQSSTASFGGQVTKLSAFGKVEHGRPERRKELARIAMAHGEVYVAQTTTAHINHFYRAIMDANEYPGPAVVVAYTPCMPEHGIADDAANAQAKLAVKSRAFPLFTYDPRRGDSMATRLSLQGNPAVKEDWSVAPNGEVTDFLTFARSEGRFAPHFAADGAPTSEIIATNQERLANWRLLQEWAGIKTQD